MKKYLTKRKHINLTKSQAWVYDFLKKSKKWTSPTKVGNEYGMQVLGKFRHSSTGSPICLRLVELGLLLRNDKGHYKIK